MSVRRWVVNNANTIGREIDETWKSNLNEGKVDSVNLTA